MAAAGEEEELLDYDDEDEVAPDAAAAKGGEAIKKGYVGIHATGFRDFLLKPELLRAIVDCGFEHPSEVQHECIPQAILGMHVLCQARSGMGKTAVFVLSVLQQLDTAPATEGPSAIILCHTRELAFQIMRDFKRFTAYLPEVNVAVIFGGVNRKTQVDELKTNPPHIIVATPGRLKDLVQSGDLNLTQVRHFILDECDKMLETDMRQDVQEIFLKTPKNKQVMMFSATLSKEIRLVCKKFMVDVRAFQTFFYHQHSSSFIPRCTRNNRALHIFTRNPAIVAH